MGAGCDFLTPIGHQCNTLVFGPGGYRFAGYARLGAPLSLLVVLVGTPLVLWTWPLHRSARAAGESTWQDQAGSPEIVFTSMKSARPYFPPSRPLPDCL